MQDKPVVSVICITYNHEKYIRQTFDGFLLQKTSFPIEIWVHDDASTDETKNIILEYVQKYPSLIKPIFQRENQYSRGRKITPIVTPYCQGSYIALCEGDDYWADPHKLQKQFEFMEANPDYSVCYHDAKIIDESGQVVCKSQLGKKNHRDATSDELIRLNAPILTLTMFFRNVIKEFPYEMFRVYNGDNFLVSLLGNYGNGKYMNDIHPAVYRRHGGGAWSGIDEIDKVIMRINSYYWIAAYYKRIGKQGYADYYRSRIDNQLIWGLPQKYAKKIFYRVVTSPFRKLKDMLSFGNQ